MQMFSSQLTYQSLNGALPSRKCSIKAPDKYKTSAHVLTEICLPSKRWVNDLALILGLHWLKRCPMGQALICVLNLRLANFLFEFVH